MKRHPNVLLLLTDQHAPKIAGFAGDHCVRTQHLDGLAERSVRFETVICASPVCTPSRISMLTAKEPHHCSAWNNHWPVFPEHITWPGHFSKNGYRTCLVGKMHLGGKNQMAGFQLRPYGDLHHGVGHQPEPIDLFPGYAHLQSAGETEIPESLLQDVVVSREALSFILEHHDKESDVPWFVCASYSRPHYPLTAPGRYINRYRGKVPPIELPPDYKERLEPYARNAYNNEVGCGDENFELTQELSDKAREAYYACVDFVDDCIGELLDGLENEGLLENTIIIYTSDHGEMAGVHGLWGKVVYYEPSIAVPLLISGPDIKQGRSPVKNPVSLMDLFPTTCALAGLPIPENLDGIDFSNVLSNPECESASRAFAPSAYYAYGVRVKGGLVVDETKPHNAMRVIRERNWKYVEIEGGKPILFDILNDPDEKINLAERPEYAQQCRILKKLLFKNFSWERVHTQLAIDRARLSQFLSGIKPTTPNQYMLKDGRIFDAETGLYGARWLYIPHSASAGIIPQQEG